MIFLKKDFYFKCKSNHQIMEQRIMNQFNNLLPSNLNLNTILGITIEKKNIRIEHISLFLYFIVLKVTDFFKI